MLVVSELFKVLSAVSKSLLEVVVVVPDVGRSVVVRAILHPGAGANLMPVLGVRRLYIGLDRGHGEHNLVVALVVEDIVRVHNALFAHLNLVGSMVDNQFHVALLRGHGRLALLDLLLVLLEALLEEQDGLTAVSGGVGLGGSGSLGSVLASVAVALLAAAFALLGLRVKRLNGVLFLVGFLEGLLTLINEIFVFLFDKSTGNHASLFFLFSSELSDLMGVALGESAVVSVVGITLGNLALHFFEQGPDVGFGLELLF